MPTWVTPSETNHSRIFRSSLVSVRNVLTSFRGLLWAGPTSTVATTTAWPTSTPAQRSTIASIAPSVRGTVAAPKVMLRHCHASFPFPGCDKGWYLCSARARLQSGVEPPKRRRPPSDRHPPSTWHTAPPALKALLHGRWRAKRRMRSSEKAFACGRATGYGLSRWAGTGRGGGGPPGRPMGRGGLGRAD
jgi:hypothetical protein